MFKTIVCDNSSCLEDDQTFISESDQALTESVSDSITIVFQWIFNGALSLAIVFFGIVANSIIIVCFVSQGFSYPVNISFVGLAISDIGCLATLFWTNLCYTPAFVEADLPFDSMEFQYLTSGIPHTAFSRVTSWITALITLERCLCITAPLKVKSLITRRRMTIVIMCTFILNLSSASPTYAVNKLGWKFFPNKNKTLVGLLFLDNRENVENVSYTINNILMPFTCFIIIIVCTVTLIIKLRKKSTWLKRSTTLSQGDTASNRNHKVARMVLIISLLFISCFVPISVIFITMCLEPELSFSGKYRNYFTIFGTMSLTLESINSSGNIFIYYHMSNKFKVAFDSHFCNQKNRETEGSQETRK